MDLFAAPSTAAAPQLMGQYGQVLAADAPEIAVSLGVGGQQVAPRKGKCAEHGQPPVLGHGGAANVAARFQQQQQLVDVDVDRLVLQLTEQWRRRTMLAVAAVEAAATRRLRARDEEIRRIGWLNWALEERVKSLDLGAQVWRHVARCRGAAADALRGELRWALDAQARRGVDGAGADDAESCCGGENDVAGGAAGEEEAGTTGRARCKACGEGAAEVVLLPCRHLCVCAPCADAARACPACGCAKNGSVCVNFS